MNEYTRDSLTYFYEFFPDERNTFDVPSVGSRVEINKVVLRVYDRLDNVLEEITVKPSPATIHTIEQEILKHELENNN